MMKMKRSHLSLGRICSVLGVAAVMTSALLGASPASAQDDDLAFTVKIRPTSNNRFDFSLKNESLEKITGLIVELGVSAPKFDSIYADSMTKSATVLDPKYEVGDNGMVREVFNDVPGSSVATLMAHPKYPLYPDSRNLMTGSLIPPQNYADNFGERIHGFYTPTVSGDYDFVIDGDNGSRLYIDEMLIAFVPDNEWTDYRNFGGKFPASQRATKHLNAGQTYYFKVLHQDGGGPDHVAVYWTKPTDNQLYYYNIPTGQFKTRNGTNVLATVSPGEASKVIRMINISDLGVGDEMKFTTVFATNTANAAKLLWNQGLSGQNAKITVIGESGSRGELILPDTPDNRPDKLYTFLSKSRPRDLKIVSLIQGADETDPLAYVSNYVFTVRTKTGNPITAFTNPPANQTIHNLSDGMKVDIKAVSEVYLSAATNFLYDSTQVIPESELGTLPPPRQRYVASGLSVNNTPQTGDPTQFSFDLNGDTDVEIRWRHDYALTVEHDFDETDSEELDPTGQPWAGPLSSSASGDPEPGTTKVHWYPKGEEVIAQIDGSVLDFSRPGLDIRYVPVGYRAQGSARGVYKEFPETNLSFSVGQAPPKRQQVNSFVMDGWGSIEYVWQIQYGVAVNVDDLSRSALPRVFRVNKVNGDEVEIGSLEGTFWFNPGEEVKVATAANAVAGDPTSKALTGWINGDGYYFSSAGAIDSDGGALVDGGPTVTGEGPVALWNKEFFDVNGRIYRGLSIPQLQRPARVLWSYGNQVFQDTVTIGEYMFQKNEALLEQYPVVAQEVLREPDLIQMLSVAGQNQEVADKDMAVWDPVAQRLYPTVPGKFRAVWNTGDDSSLQVLVTVNKPSQPHYPHIAGTPAVQLNPDPNGSFFFKGIKYSENEAAIQNDSLFTADKPGDTVLLFSEIKQIGRGEPQEFLRVRMVRTETWDENLSTPAQAIIGQAITDTELDLAKLDTGFILFPNARYNANIYDSAPLRGLQARDIYDMSLLRSTTAGKVVVSKTSLPGPVIPVNLHPRASGEERIVVVWYYDPTLTDEIMWPYRARTYMPKWPTNESQGLNRIVIASQFGSDCVNAAGSNQWVAASESIIAPDGEGGILTNVFPAVTTYDPSRIQQPIIYVQADPNAPGYNPNEEHALMADSRRFGQASPRPKAAYALRNKDLNVYNTASTTEANQPVDYTSHPYVLVQFFDVATESYGMRVYKIEAEDSNFDGYMFANQSRVTIPAGSSEIAASGLTLFQEEPYVQMEAGEPVIPFYPLGVVIGASPAPETFGINIKTQSTYWEDHKGSSWAVSGGENAWFTYSIYYPMAPDFWWPPNKPGHVVYDEFTETSRAYFPSTGDSVSFVPANIGPLKSLSLGSVVTPSVLELSKPKKILYKSDWPAVAPILKAGETLTFSGGEFRADHPTIPALDDNGQETTVQTPGLPAVLAFAVGEVVFDALNPRGETALLKDSWTVRMAQVLDVRTEVLPIGNFPTKLLPANGLTRVSGGKYVFNDLPASLQKRFRYDPLATSVDPATGLTINGRLEISGLVNDKDIGDNSLTAPPPAVYVLEPNIMTKEDKEALFALADDTETAWRTAVESLYQKTLNPNGLQDSNGQTIRDTYLVGLQPEVQRDPVTDLPKLEPIEPGSDVLVPQKDEKTPEAARQFGPGLALVPNGGFLQPLGTIPNANGGGTPFPDESWVTVAENNDPSQGGSPVTLHVIKVDRKERYRGAIKVVESDNVFDENIVLRHTGDFGANPDDLVFEWWYRPDDGQLNVPPPFIVDPDSAGSWLPFPDTSGRGGRGRNQILLKGNPNTPETLLADSWWFVRYRHKSDYVEDTNWYVPQQDGTGEVNFEWAGAGNNDPFNDFDLDGYPDYLPQLASGWIKRVMNAVNPYEARIRDFEGDSPATVSSMLQQLGPRYEGPVALNPDKDVIENVGLIELYETVLNRGRELSINLSNPVSTPAIANALQLASTRISDFYMLLGNEAYSDAMDPTIGFGSSSVEYGSLAPVVLAFQNQMSSLGEEELSLLRGVNNNYARPVYNRLFWNFTMGEGEAAYAMNYNISDINNDGFINEDDAMILYPMGHGDAWGHYLTAVRKQYDLLRNADFNWVSRSEFVNIMDIVVPVDFLDERKFAQAAAARARAGAEVVQSTYRENYVEDPTAQWQGYTDVNPDRAWGVQGWARRAGQGAYFDWVTANALLPSQHPNISLEGIQKVDRQANDDIRVISANLNTIQRTFDDANNGYNPLGVSADAVPFDINLESLANLRIGRSHFEQMYDRAVGALNNALKIWDRANLSENRLRKVANTEAAFRNSVYQEDLAYRNKLIEIFGRPYDGTVGPGMLYPAGYDGPDIALYAYVNVREINDQTVPGPTTTFASFSDSGTLTGGDMLGAYNGSGGTSITTLGEDMRTLFSPTFVPSDGTVSALARDGLYAVDYTDLVSPKVELDNFVQLMPIKASGYTFQAPAAWGSRPAVGELQVIINQMIRQEAEVARAIGAWDGLTGGIIREMRVVNSQLATGSEIRERNEAFIRSKYIIGNILKGIRGAKDILAATKDTVTETIDAAFEAIPSTLPTGGLAVSPGDALAPVRGGLLTGTVAFSSGISIAEATLRGIELANEIAFDIAENEVNLANTAAESTQSKREMLRGLEDMVGDEPVLRIEIFKQIEALRALSEKYISKVAEGARLIDERAAFNKRVAAMTQQNRYQDMTFRVHRNHALEQYRSMFDLAAQYTYLAAKAYDYETNFDTTDPASPFDLYSKIVRTRTLGEISGGQPQIGDGIAGILAQLNVNFSLLESQLGFTTPQTETGKLSLRTELFRILPTGTQPVGNTNFPGGGVASDLLWEQTLEENRVDNLWEIPEYRYYAKPFASDIDENGDAVPEPGLVLRFGTEIIAGKNVFGRPLSGGDHAYDPSLFATKVRGVGVWFSNYRSDDVLNDLPEAPRVYLIPVGSDIMSIVNSPTPENVRIWNVVDQLLPVPIPAESSRLDQSNFIPLLDTMNGRMGDPRRFSSFRAYHDAGSALLEDEIVFDSRLVGRSVWNTEWMLIIPGLTLNSDPNEGLDRFIAQVEDIKLVFQTYGHAGN